MKPDNLPGKDDNESEVTPEADVRNDIVSRAREKREADNVEYADEISQLEELHGVTGEEAPTPKTPDTPEVETIKVNGQQEAVPVNDLVEAGKNALQMEKAAQQRFQEAARVRDEYERKLSELNRPDEPDSIVPEQDEAAEKISEDQFVETMMYGENEENLRKIYQDIHNKKSDDNLAETVDERIAQKEQQAYQERYEADRVAGNEAFIKDFPEMNDPKFGWMRDIASGEAQRLKQQYPKEAPSRILHQAGLNTRQIVMDTIGMGAEHAGDDKTKLKQSLPSQTRQANVRRTSKEQQKAPSKADIVNNMRGQRGQAEL